MLKAGNLQQAAITHTAVRESQNGNEKDVKDNSKRRET